MFKKRLKVDTSGYNMLRNEKRERILSIAFHGILQKAPTDDDPGMTRLEVHAFDRDYLDWKISMIESAGWLTKEDVERASFAMWMSWKDSNKLRIYHKWLHHSKRRTLRNVLKYMYSPFFPAVFFMECGGIDEEYKCAYLRLETGQPDDNKLLVTWFKDIFDLDTTILIGEFNIPHLVFFGENRDKFLDIIEPIVQQVPSKYAKFRR